MIAWEYNNRALTHYASPHQCRSERTNNRHLFQRTFWKHRQPRQVHNDIIESVSDDKTSDVIVL